jgi:hypothetical protein
VTEPKLPAGWREEKTSAGRRLFTKPSFGPMRVVCSVDFQAEGYTASFATDEEAQALSDFVVATGGLP